MPEIILDYFDGKTRPKTITVDYPDLDPRTLRDLAMGGDKGAVDYLNSLSDEQIDKLFGPPAVTAADDSTA